LRFLLGLPPSRTHNVREHERFSASRDEDRTPTHGYEATREEAMAAFAKAGGGSEGMSAFGAFSDVH
jgi:hypothetical protein